MRRHRHVLAVLLVAVVGLAACSDEARDQIGDAIGGGQTEQDGGAAEDPPAASAPEEAPEEPAQPDVPDEPEAETPDEPAAEDDGADGAETTSAVVLALVLLGVVLVAYLLRRRSGPEPAAAPAAGAPSTALVYWRSRARSAYADARWVHDHLDDATATWRGQQLADPDDVDPLDPRGRDWHAAETRVPAVLDQLYALEADAPGSDERGAVGEVARCVRDVDGAARALAARLRDDALDRVRVATAEGRQEPDVIVDLGLAEADRLRTARGRLGHALAAFQVFLADA